MSLFTLAKGYISESIKSYASQGALVSLIVDENTKESLLRLIPKDTLLRFVTSMETIDSPRRIQPYIESVYLVEPTEYNLSCIEADLSVKRYKKFHGLFISPPEAEAQRNYGDVLRGLDSSRIIPFGVYLDEERVWRANTKTGNVMPVYYKEDCRDLVMDQIAVAAHSLVSMCVICGEYPLVRYYSPQEGNYAAKKLPELIASEFQLQIDSYARQNEDFPPANDRPRSILIITDRTMDLFAPILHEFTYQAMSMDIIEELEKESKYTYTTENERGEEKKVTVTMDDEKDPEWLSLRHLHIIEASEFIVARINDLIAKNPKMVDRSNATTASDLIYIVAHLQGFDQERKQLTLHKSLIDECLDINAQRKLAEFAADFEQTCAAGGLTFEGERNKNLADDLIVLLARDDLHINDKMRLVVLYSLYRGGIIEADFKKLVKFIGLNDAHMDSVISRCFHNLELLGCPIVKSDIKIKRIEKRQFHLINNEGTFNTSRFSPGVKNILQSAQKYQLDEEWFPYFRDKPLEDEFSNKDSDKNGAMGVQGSLRNQRIKASWAQQSYKVGQGDDGYRSSSRQKPRQRVFCWVAGGMTYSEMRSVYELSNSTGADFFIGSETILKPRDFLIGLQSIDKNKNRQDLAIHWDQKLRTKAPKHLWEVPKSGNEVSGSSIMGSQSQSGSSGSTNTGILSGNTPIPQHQSSSGLPQHYQIKQSSSQVELPQSDNKEKKKSRLKRFFK